MPRSSWGERLVVWPVVALLVAAVLLVLVVLCGGLVLLAEVTWSAVLG